jgi:hypothetical protein
MAFQQADGQLALQELYQHLDCIGLRGNQQIAWYGQCRAQGMTHAEALADSIEKFGLEREAWYRFRFEGKPS